MTNATSSSESAGQSSQPPNKAGVEIRRSNGLNIRIGSHHFTTSGRLWLWLLNSGAYMHWISATPVS
jgi:hypothetical protein